MYTRRITLLLALVLLVAGGGAAFASPSGMEVMENVYTRPTGKSMSADLTMTLTNARGATRERRIKQYRLETGEVDKKLMFFLAPADVRDTSFMSWSYNDQRDDDQWIYIPTLRRVKRISAESRDKRFMGSDFTYDDLGERHPREDRHTLLREEQLRGERCYVVESHPRDDDEAYAKTVSWISAATWMGLKREFYSAAGELYKVLTIDEYEKIDGYWIITDMTMKDLSRDHSTRIAMDNVEFDIGLSDSFFSERRMKRGPRR